MFSRCLSTALIAAVLCLTLPAQAFAGDDQEANAKAQPNLMQAKAAAYAFSSQSGSQQDGAMETHRIPLSPLAYSSSTSSPGAVVFVTYRDEQQVGSMGRMIETGPHSDQAGTQPTVVHMGATGSPGPTLGYTYCYNYYHSGAAILGVMVYITDPVSWQGHYVNVDVSPDNRVVVGGQYEAVPANPGSESKPWFWPDACPGCQIFYDWVAVPDSLSQYMQDQHSYGSSWPKFFFQHGDDTVLHVVARVHRNTYAEEVALMYYRLVGYEDGPDTDWDYPPYVVDSISTPSHDITGVRGGNKVAIAWTANLAYEWPDCDTCSGRSVYDDTSMAWKDNDVYYQISNDQGASWQPRVNLTKVPIGEAAYKAYCDLSILFDAGDYFHIVWNAVPWPADECIESGGGCFADDFDPYKSRLFHWSENVPYIRTIADHTYDAVDSCGPGYWDLRVAKPTISECNNKLYTIWTQFNDPRNGILHDCAQWGYDDETYAAAANGDIWLSVSQDGGLTWDFQRNLTNSQTPHCNPGDCENDHWASMNRWGREVRPDEYWTWAPIVDPSGGGSPTDWYLDVQYVVDGDAGRAEYGEGSWTNNCIRYFRIPCVEAVLCSYLIPEWTQLGYPYSVHSGQEKDTTLMLENTGTLELTYGITVIEDNGPAGWLGVSGFSGTIPANENNIDTGTVILNQGGIITQTGIYYGRLHLEGNDIHNLPMDIEIELVVTDTIVRDVISSSCLSLIVSDIGNMGMLGNNGDGTLNMDFYPDDCDSTAKVYLYDGSPLIGRIIGSDTVFNEAIWDDIPGQSEYSFVPVGGVIPTAYSPLLDANVFESGTVTTQDGTIAFEKIWVAPASNCNIIYQHFRVWSHDEEAHNDVMLGEVIDWNIPFDYREDDPLKERPNVNYGRALADVFFWQLGYESPTDTGYPYDCQLNDGRAGLVFFMESRLNETPRASLAYGCFYGENDSLRFGDTFHAGWLYDEMALPGSRATDSLEDIHMVMTFEKELDLAPTDVYEVVTMLITGPVSTDWRGELDAMEDPPAELLAAIDAGEIWYDSHGGMSMFEDENGDGQMDICEYCCMIVGDFFHDGELTPADIVGMIEYAWKGGSPPGCEDELDVNGDGEPTTSDISYLIEYAWKFGPPPAPCPPPE